MAKDSELKTSDYVVAKNPVRGTNIKVGDSIRIIRVNDQTQMSPDHIDHQARKLNGKEGVVTHIDGKGQLFGTWGGLAVLPDIDQIVVLPR